MMIPAFRVAVLAASVSLAVGMPAAGAAAAAVAADATATAAMASPAALGSGIDRAGMDAQARPRDDLFQAMNGTWLKNTAIPADKASWGSFAQLRDRTDVELKSLVEALLDTRTASGSNAQKIADYYRAWIDVAAIDKAAIAPVVPALKEVDAVADTTALLALIGRWQGLASLPLVLDPAPDFRNPDVYTAGYAQGGLGLPDRDYYLKDDARFESARAAYATYLIKLFLLSGDEQAIPHAEAVMALEKKLADAQWTRVELRDMQRVYNPKTPAELDALAPGLAWPAFAAAASLPAGATVNVEQPSYVAALAVLLRSEPVSTWRLYLKARRLDARADVLPAAFREASFAFHGRALLGLQQERPRWQSAMAALNGALGEATGQLYVGRYFPPASRARAQALVANLMKAYSSSIDGLAWMSSATKAAAHDKLSKYRVKIGYPDAWRDYSALEIRPGEAVGNAERGAAFDYRRRIVRVGQNVDRAEWDMTPQTINAYYDPSLNEIVFPAAILQPPFFDVNAEDAVNYGGIGTVIGHEISHGFDDQGAEFDGDGRLRNWWTADDRKAFDAITGRLVEQYAGYQPLPGKNLNGKLTLGENIADLSGLQISFKAYRISLGAQPSPVIDGITGEQRFFYGFAQVWREKTREERLLQSIVTNPHAPGRFRADGAAINADGFHEAFGTRPGDAMWKAPADRIRLW